MPLPPLSQPYYLNGPSLASATAVFSDAAMTICAPDGFYSDGVIVRELSGCVLLPPQTCEDCCADVCWGLSVELPGIDDFCDIGYYNCYTQQYVEETIVGPYNQVLCVLYGTIIDVFITRGSTVPDINIAYECGCCPVCSQFEVTPIGGNAVISYRNCSGASVEEEIDDVTTVCVLAGQYIEIVEGNASIIITDCCTP